MQDLLFLAHRIPYPPDKGDKIRSWHILKFLAKRYRVHLGCFVDDPRDRRHQAHLEKLCGESCFVPLGPVATKLRSLRGLLRGDALTLAHYRDPRMTAWVEDLVRRVGPTRVFVFSAAMAPYAMGPAFAAATRVIDFVDVDSDKWRQYAATKRRWTRWLYRREGRRLVAFERRAAMTFDASLFVSAHEAALFRKLAPDQASRIHHLDNGVDGEYFSPDLPFDRPFPEGGQTIVFTGAMDYWPNIEAVTWFANEVLPIILAKAPAVRFFIVGANPPPELRKLGRLPSITVTGRVPDVRPYLAHADVAVAPLRIARGIQNKVLEAMAMSKPVVATPQAVEGIHEAAQQDIRVAAEADAFAAATIALLGGDTAREIGRRARERVLSDYGWPESLERLSTHLEGPPAVDAGADATARVGECA